MRSEHEANLAIEKYGDMVKRICFLHLKNEFDTEDIFQNVFIKYLVYEGEFENSEHEKAWLARVTINLCKDFLKSAFRKNTVSMEYLSENTPAAQDEEKREVLRAVLSLPDKYKNAVYLHYYEGYTAGEIGKIIGKKENSVYTLLARAREKLKKILGGDDFE
ncbi:MAG: sigma-70 family RNA polymerase sigma factor [Acutalibacteraceae bacterium]|nr:sigma-70 family RNA polymerase sigma factor [Acutalibacteraceae bacterium]